MIATSSEEWHTAHYIYSGVPLTFSGHKMSRTESIERAEFLRLKGWLQDENGLWYTIDRPNLKFGLSSAYYSQLRKETSFIRLTKEV